MGNSVSDATITVLCKCGQEMKSSTPEKVYQKRYPCSVCHASIPHAGVLFHHCNYDLCEQCAKKKAIKVFCKHCDKTEMEKSRLNNNNLSCDQCKKRIQISKTNKYIYQCEKCNICMECAKNPEIMQIEQQKYFNNVNKLNKGSNLRRVMTTLHGYEMQGPYTPDKNMVWYCDNKTCQYTKHGLYRKYRIDNWRSSQFGKKFVLCDGCVRQYEKQQPVVIVQPQVNVDVNLNMNNNDNNFNDNIFHRSETEIISQPEGVVSRTMTYM